MGAIEERPRADEGSDSVADRIVSSVSRLSRKHQRIARFVLDHQDVIAFASAHEVGIETGASAATVVRFCQALGYEGYHHLREAIRARLSLERAALEKLERRMEGTDNHDLPTQVFAVGIGNLERTAVLTSAERLWAAAEAIRRARHVFIVGSGLAAMLVECLAYYLQTMDVSVRHVTGGEEQLALALTFSGPEDVVIAISFRRQPRYALKAIEHARAIGATSIGIANSELSPVLREAGYSFQVITDSVIDRPSPVAAVALLDALVAAVSLAEPEEAAKSQQRIDTTFKESGLLEE
jgi:DNA-binding MurR/RpiR family transcriptional regulator